MATRSGLGRRLHTHEHSMCCRSGTNMGETQCLYLEIDRHNQHHDATQPNHIVSPLLLSSHQYQQILERCMCIRQHGSVVYVGIHAGPRIPPTDPCRHMCSSEILGTIPTSLLVFVEVYVSIEAIHNLQLPCSHSL